MNALMNLLVMLNGAMTQHLPDSSTDLCLCTVPLSGQKINAECEHLKHPLHCHRAHHKKQVTRTPILTVLSCPNGAGLGSPQTAVSWECVETCEFSKPYIGGLRVCSVGASSCEANQSGALPLIM